MAVVRAVKRSRLGEYLGLLLLLLSVQRASSFESDLAELPARDAAAHPRQGRGI